MGKIGRYTQLQLVKIMAELYYFDYYFRRLEKDPYREGIKIFITTYYNMEDFERLGIRFTLPLQQTHAA